jgi:biotin transport system substrate-specific component
MQSTYPLQLGVADGRRLARTLTGRILLAIAATGLVAVCAHVSVPLYLTPVPATLQTLAVLLVGMALGPAAGFSAMALYLVEGAMGMPVFSPHGAPGLARLVGPASMTAGFLFSYPLAAAVAGAVVRMRGLRRSRFTAAIVAGVSASVIIFAMGAGWLAHLLHLTPAAAWHMAVEPFLPGEVLKVSGAAAGYAALRRWSQS